MLTTIQVFSLEPNAPTLLLDSNGTIETDLLQVRNVTGLDPVKATINTTQLGSMDGTVYSSSSVPSRNVVITLHPNPDWVNWRVEGLRKLLYVYFTPKKPVLLVFYFDDRSPVQIEGFVEGINGDLFSSDNEYQISIICPYPYFTSVDPIVITGTAADNPITINYLGTVPSGIVLEIVSTDNVPPSTIDIHVGDPWKSYFSVYASVDNKQYFVMSSIPGQKIIENVKYSSGTTTNLLSDMADGSTWPILLPGPNAFNVDTDDGLQSWTLQYFDRLAGL